jgi:hypothetical protein
VIDDVGDLPGNGGAVDLAAFWRQCGDGLLALMFGLGGIGPIEGDTGPQVERRALADAEDMRPTGTEGEQGGEEDRAEDDGQSPTS